ncbi:GNAT family N-acetyltransferase [Spiribacter onubensis]|uniref:N-acetyltransferase n=1 Tax=Spiribacter onubensis TaxID=3122420 RepID=A0ABV3S737_9GAMM
MYKSTQISGRERALADLFRRTFTDSEGEAEGRLIGDLVRQLLDTTASEELRLFTIDQTHESAPLAAAIFTRLVYSEDARVVFLLSPVAVRTDHQGQGIGKDLLSDALRTLKAEGVDVVVTYGDPAFYGQLGFRPVSTFTLPAPFDLSQPMGWLAVALDGKPIHPLAGAVHCVEAMNRPDVW